MATRDNKPKPHKQLDAAGPKAGLGVPPQNTEAEASVLGALLIDSDAIVKVADLLVVEDFYDERHARIFEAARTLYERHQPIDVLTLSDQLSATGFLEMIGGASYLTELTNFVPTAAHAEQYANIIAEKAMRRRLIKASQDISAMGFDETQTLQELVELAESRLFEVSQQKVKQDLISIEDVLGNSFERLEELHRDKGKLRGVPTGFRDMDAMLAGWQPSDLIILAARPSMGKTALSLNLAHNVAVKANLPVIFFSLEMSKEQLVDRMLSAESGVDSWKLRTGDLDDSDFEKIGLAMGTLSEAPIYIDDTPGITVSDMRTKARREAHQHPLGLIIVDYLQLMSGGARFSGSDNRVQEISEISRGLKGIARELKVPLIALSQLSRSVESRNPQIPQLADLRESGCLTGDTPIYLPKSGTYVPIRELVGAKNVTSTSLSMEDWKIENAPIINAFSTGIKPVYTITLKSGKTITATANHKFLTIGGWKRLDELSLHEHLATPRHLPSVNTASMEKSEVALLGHLIGDGCTLPRHVIQYTTKDEDLAQEVVALTNSFFGDSITPRVNPEQGWIQVYLPSTQKLTHGKMNPIAKWLRELGVFGLRSYEKYVPEKVFQQPLEVISVFLRHLWATDGCIYMPQNSLRMPAIYYASSSFKLAQNVQSLLLRFGIHARVSRKPQVNKGRDQYHVIISGQEDMMIFAAKIGAVGVRKNTTLNQIVELPSNQSLNPNKDIIPKSVWDTIVKPSLALQSISTRAFQNQLNTAYCGTALYKSNLSRQRALKVATAIKSETLSKIAQSDVYWDRIASIEASGIEEVYDLTIPKNHNFVAADIIVHNSIEQDADVVAFIYREEYYNPETENKNITKILIKKHRNGATGDVDLYFEKEKQRFRSLDTRHSSPFEA